MPAVVPADGASSLAAGVSSECAASSAGGATWDIATVGHSGIAAGKGSLAWTWGALTLWPCSC